MKYVIFNEVYDTNALSAAGIENFMQTRLDAWLGVGNVRVEVNLPADNVMEVTLWRNYGPWYEDPKRFSSCNDTINSWDETIFLGTDYQTGTTADFQNHNGRYKISHDVDSIFLPELQEMAKRHRGSKVKGVSVDNNLDHVTLTIELAQRKP